MEMLLLFAFGFGVFLVSLLGTVAGMVAVGRQQADAAGVDAEPVTDASSTPTLRIVRDREAA